MATQTSGRGSASPPFSFFHATAMAALAPKGDGSGLQQSGHLNSGPLAPTGRRNAALLQTGYNGAGMTSQPAACSS